MKIPNRYEIHYVLDGGFTQKIGSKDILKQAKQTCNNMSAPTTIIDKCTNKRIKP